ncbi:MAG TPA: class I SAM-dependent methyltransferase [Bryobacteraceae bacterium]|nr:class I SAM-dependent methyltransferase [Bryobacteraceae bacterium]
MEKCFCCGSTPVGVAYTVKSFPIVRCSYCGAGRTRLDARFDFTKYYTEAYFQGGVADGYADYLGSEQTLRPEFRRILAHLCRLNCTRGRLLEFGCAYGFLLREAEPLFEQVEGIELSSDAVRFCRLYGLQVREGSVDEATLQGNYDVIVGLDVIEHVPDPQDTIRLITRHLNPGGLLLMTTGDWGSPLARVMGPRWRLMTPPQHLSFFTAKSMRLILESAGLRVLELSHPGKWVPLSLITYQLQRLAGFKPRLLSVPGSWGLPMNLWDAMRVIAMKADPS